MKIIRIWGIGLFVVILLLITLLWYLLAPTLIRSTIEQTGTEALGAKVAINNVDLSLFPLAVTINGLTAADPDKPMTNIADINSISFGVDTGALVWKKVVIDKLVIDGVKTGTPRQTSGALEGGRKTTQAIAQAVDFEMPELTEEQLNKMIDDADLITLKRIDQFKAEQATIKSDWQKALDKKAFDKRTAKIKAEYKRLADRAKANKFNLLKDAKDWKKLKKAINAERDNLKSLKTKLNKDKAQLAQSLKSVKAGPKDDLNAVLANVGLDNGIASLSDKYLGPQFTPWVEKALAMVKEAKASSGDQTTEAEEKYSRSKGKKIRFKDEQLFPDVLVKQVIISGQDSSWTLAGDGANLGYFPWLVGEPAKLDLEFADGKKGNANFKLKTDWPNENKMLTTINGKVSNWSVSNMQLMKTGEQGWMINSGSLSAAVNGNVTLEKLDLNLSVTLSSPKIAAPEDISGWQKTLAQSLNQQKQIQLSVSAKGTLDEPTIKMDSSLESLFKDAIGQKLKKQADKYKDKIAKKLSNKIGDLSALDSYTKDFDGWGKGINLNDGALKDLLGKVKL